MDFSSFNLTHQTYIPRTLPTSKMGDDCLYSFPLTGHLDSSKSYQNLPWGYLNTSKLSNPFKISTPLNILPSTKMSDMRKNVLSYVVGGFVGSKSQRNVDSLKPFPIGEMINNLLEQNPKKEEKSQACSSQLKSMVSNIFLGLSGKTDGNVMSGFGIEIPSCPKEEEVMFTCANEEPMCLRAMRLLSECSVDSNDSDFVVFGDNVDISSNDEDGWTDASTDDDCEDEEDDDIEIKSNWDAIPDSPVAAADYNCPDFCGTVICKHSEEDEGETRLAEITDKWNKFYGSPIDQDKSPRPCVVKFTNEVKVRVMRVWDFASRAARISHWEEVGRDRVRFWERIKRTEEILSPVLQPEHREKMRQYIEEKR